MFGLHKHSSDLFDYVWWKRSKNSSETDISGQDFDKGLVGFGF